LTAAWGFLVTLGFLFLRRRNHQRPSANPGEQANHKQHEQHQFRRNPAMVRTVVLARQCLPPGVAYANADFGKPAVARHAHVRANQPAARQLAERCDAAAVAEHTGHGAAVRSVGEHFERLPLASREHHDRSPVPRREGAVTRYTGGTIHAAMPAPASTPSTNTAPPITARTGRVVSNSDLRKPAELAPYE
jgi:hypothetical protein